MIPVNLSFQLPPPWRDVQFVASHVGPINFLVGPNGSGKSRFAEALRSAIQGSRILGTERLSGMENASTRLTFFGDNFAQGYAKNHFGNFRAAGQRGAGIDTIVLLEERLDLRVQVEATLSHLFNRRIILEWDSGHLIPRATLGESGTSYRLDRDECHGIKELLVLLTHLYNREYRCLIIDEPELNLHPQYQAFLMQEIRKFAGDPAVDATKKLIFLVTHSPFILDFRSIDDVRAVMSFDLEHSRPRRLLDLDANTTSQIASLVPRLNVHHKQLFFSDTPIFVEGILDAQIVSTIQDARGVSMAAAGSCVIDAGGCEEVNRYLVLCSALAKKAHFLYDLDSLFSGNLRSCIKDDEGVQSFLLSAGLGSEFVKYCGELDRSLTDIIDKLLSEPSINAQMTRLLSFLRALGERRKWDKSAFAKARVSVLVALGKHRSEFVSILSESEVAGVEGRVKQVVSALRQKNVHLLSSGALEHFLPSYSGDIYALDDESKRDAVVKEMETLSVGMSEQALKARYGELFEIICQLPSKVGVDIDASLRSYLGYYIHDLQGALTRRLDWSLSELQVYLKAEQKEASRLFSVTRLERPTPSTFEATIEVAPIADEGRGVVRVDHQTNAGMGNFRIERPETHHLPN